MTEDGKNFLEDSLENLREVKIKRDGFIENKETIGFMYNTST